MYGLKHVIGRTSTLSTITKVFFFHECSQKEYRHTYIMNDRDMKRNLQHDFVSPQKNVSGVGALGRHESATNNDPVLPPWVYSDSDHYNMTNIDPNEFQQLAVRDRRIVMFNQFQVFCQMMERGWIKVCEAEAFYRRVEYLLAKGTSLLRTENVAQRKKDCLEKLQERQDLGNLSTDLQDLEAAVGLEVMKDFYIFRTFVVNLLSSDEHARKITHFCSMCECLFSTKKVQRQMQDDDKEKEKSYIMKSPFFHLRGCLERIEGKRFESLEKALDNVELLHDDTRHVSFQSLSIEDQIVARRSCELRNDTLSNLTFSALWMHRCWPDMIQHYIGKNTIPHKRLLDLREGEWIYNEIVDAYFSLLNSHCMASEIFLGALHHTTKIYDGNELELKVLFDIFKKKEKILFPIHVDKTHWHLALITMKSNFDFDIDIFDSYCVSQKAQQEKYFAPVLDLMSKIMAAGGHSNYEVQNKSFPFISGGGQKNGCDCGIFMCMTAAALAGMIDVNWYEIDQDYITSKNCRASICASLITREIQKPLS
jgi:hypothetical protein